MEAHYNIMMDKRAGSRRRLCRSIPASMPMTTDLASLMLKGCYITADISQQITMDSTKSGMRAYIIQKNDWSEATFDSVDWTASMGYYLKRLLVSKRVKAPVKMMHNGQNTGRQKGLL